MAVRRTKIERVPNHRANFHEQAGEGTQPPGYGEGSVGKMVTEALGRMLILGDESEKAKSPAAAILAFDPGCSCGLYGCGTGGPPLFVALGVKFCLHWGRNGLIRVHVSCNPHKRKEAEVLAGLRLFRVGVFPTCLRPLVQS